MFPKRAAFAAFVTILALVAILTYQTPALPAAPSDNGSLVAPPVAAVSATDVTTSPDAAASGPTFDPFTFAETGPDPWTPPPGSTPGATPGSTFGSTPGWTPGSNPAGAGASTPRPGSNATPQPTPAPIAPTPPPVTQPNPTPPPVTAPPRTPAPGFSGKLTGPVVSMKYGPVQVQAVYSGGRLSNVVTLQTPTGDSHSASIAQRACPILRSEALSAQSAKIHTVSGATYTSKAYIASLQAAIDAKP